MHTVDVVSDATVTLTVLRSPDSSALLVYAAFHVTSLKLVKVTGHVTLEMTVWKVRQKLQYRSLRCIKASIYRYNKHLLLAVSVDKDLYQCGLIGNVYRSN